MVAQSIGAILGAGILRVLVPANSVRGDIIYNFTILSKSSHYLVCD